MRKWMWFVIGFLVLSCCGLLGAIGGATGTTPQARQAVSDVVSTVAPLPTEKPAPSPTVDTFLECKSEVDVWRRQLLVVSESLMDSMTAVGKGDLVGGYENFKDTRLMYLAVSQPTCDEDAMSMHNRMGEVVQITERAFKAMSNADFVTSAELLKEAGAIVNMMSGTMEAINRKYGW